jgi:hypothetical protein
VPVTLAERRARGVEHRVVRRRKPPRRHDHRRPASERSPLLPVPAP